MTSYKVTVQCVTCGDISFYHEYGTHTVPNKVSTTCTVCFSIAMKIIKTEKFV